MFRRVFLVVVAVAAFGVVAMPAVAAKGGNSEAAKKCQKGGWENYVRADQTPFTSQEECTSYAAQGGVVTEPYYAPRALCEAGDYRGVPYVFSDEEFTSENTGGTSYFRCFSGTDLSFAANYGGSPEVIAACTAYEDGARIGSVTEAGDISGVECYGPYHGP